MSKIKSASQFDGEAWSNPIPIGVDDANIDVTSDTTDPNTDTGTDLGSADVTVAPGDTGASAWTKFNRFRKRVSNAFGSFTGKTLVSSYDTTNPGDKVYTASVLNNYMSNVLGYTGTTTPTINGSQQTVSSALNSIFGNGVKSITRDGTTFTATRLDGTTFTFTQQDNDTTYSNVSKTAAGLCPQLPDETTTTKYLRQDGSWVTPPDNDTITGTSYEAGSCPDNTTFGTNGSIAKAYTALNNNKLNISQIAAGTASTKNENGYFRSASVNFGKTFSKTPIVVATIATSLAYSVTQTRLTIQAFSATKTGCTIVVGDQGGNIGSTSINVAWIAVAL